MDQEEMTKLAEMTAVRTASIVVKQLADMRIGESNDLIDSKEAARLLGLTPSYVRSMKDKFPHVKVGNHSRDAFCLSVLNCWRITKDKNEKPCWNAHSGLALE